MRLKDRVALVTGAAQGIGLATAERFAAEGAKVVLADLNGPKVHAAAAKLSCVGFEGDLSTPTGAQGAVAKAIESHGSLDILVNNAGGSGRANANDIEAVTDEIWDQVVGLNLRSTFLCCRAAIPHMKKRGYGRIVNVSSGIARGAGRPTGTAGAVLPYAAAKAGVLGLTFTLAKMVAAANITVNAVVPGFVLTEPGARVRDWFEGLAAPAQKALLERTSMGRAGTAAEVAATIVFLASEEASLVSGAALDVTGAA